jgi:hypothetical protein
MQQIIECKETKIAFGRYRGISFKIHYPFEQYNWCYYIYLILDKFSDKELANSLWLEPTITEEGWKFYCYSACKPIMNLYFHGGCSWYRKIFTLDDKRCVELGCDYSHIDDIGQFYTLEDILKDVKLTIDSLYEQFDYQGEEV